MSAHDADFVSWSEFLRRLIVISIAGDTLGSVALWTWWAVSTARSNDDRRARIAEACESIADDVEHSECVRGSS